MKWRAGVDTVKKGVFCDSCPLVPCCRYRRGVSIRDNLEKGNVVFLIQERWRVDLDAKGQLIEMKGKGKEERKFECVEGIEKERGRRWGKIKKKTWILKCCCSSLRDDVCVCVCVDVCECMYKENPRLG